MTDENRLNRLRQTCNGIRRFYDGRLQINGSLKRDLEAPIQSWRELTARALNE